MTARQQALDLTPPSSRQWQPHTSVDSEVMTQLRDLNTRFLDLLLSDHGGIRDGGFSGKNPDIAASLRNLDATQRTLLASSPFTLFDAQFKNGQLWSALSHEVLSIDTAGTIPYPPTMPAAIIEFIELALFYAWHLVRSKPLAARILLAMPEQTMDAFKLFSLSHLRQIARHRPELLLPRWPERIAFWRGFTEAAQQTEDLRLAEMRALGIQMIAAEIPGP